MFGLAENKQPSLVRNSEKQQSLCRHWRAGSFLENLINVFV
jgi:hypothetical protein